MKSPLPKKPVMTPEAMNTAFAEAYNSGNMDNLLDLYEQDGILVNSNGGIDQGMDRIRKTLEGLLQLQGNMVSTNIYCIPFENIALLRAHFILQFANSDGDPTQIQGHTSEIVRQQPDGSWLYIVDHPFGADELRKGMSVG